MVFRLKERLARKFEEEVQFFKGWQKDKKRVGALMPTSFMPRVVWQALSIRHPDCRFLSWAQ
ncbi:hypothetical protein DBIPINDM_007775 (plasmid) [Mesorhizobium sp. AR02]|nr:hypothetical protein DBIPINDM_007775 [Mesorhizobium sp. AR02]